MLQSAKEFLIEKYNVPAPRYTSYPTVPGWDKAVPDAGRWLDVVKRTFDESNDTRGISLYIHLPFCESLCTYCGCNTRITRNHGVETGYLEAVLREWQIYLRTFGRQPVLRELHLGGGTPTFFSPANLRKLLEGIFAGSVIHPDREFSFEGHPNNTTAGHLQTLYDLGFRRVSFGIQDCDEKVQRTINRVQPFENVRRVTEQARRIGYESVNFDLIYGLPYQTLESVAATIDQVATLRPDRIAFYSYAHVPWIKPGQRSYTDKDLPADACKRALYELGLEKFRALGYTDIGMDHFALPGDALCEALHRKTLHRNFMGYTTCHTDLLLGLGVSSISDAKYAYLQNEKKVEDYSARMNAGELAVLKGHFLTPEDLLVRDRILGIACKGELTWQPELPGVPHEIFGETLGQMEREGLVTLEPGKLTVTPLGKAFVRNICMVFDRRQPAPHEAGQQVFSKAI
jgi:oxygen-independent coproporphyrinogen-3 oxidase